MTKTKKKTQTKPSQNYDMKVFYFILDLFLPVNQRDWEHVIAPAYEYVTGISRNWEAMRRKYKLLVKDHDTESIRIESIIAAKKGNQSYTNKWLGDVAVTAEVDEDDEDDDNDDDDEDDSDADDADNNDDNTDADVDDTYDPDADPDPAVYGEEYDANDSIDFGFDATSERIDELTRENERLTREVERLTRELEMTRNYPSSSSSSSPSSSLSSPSSSSSSSATNTTAAPGEETTSTQSAHDLHAFSPPGSPDITHRALFPDLPTPQHRFTTTTATNIATISSFRTANGDLPPNEISTPHLFVDTTAAATNIATISSFQTANGDLPPNEISTPHHLFADTTAAATNIATISSFQTANGDLPPTEISTPHHLFVDTTAAATNIATISSFQMANGDLPPNETLTPEHLFADTTTAATNVATISSFRTANGDMLPNETLTPQHLFVDTTTAATNIATISSFRTANGDLPPNETLTPQHLFVDTTAAATNIATISSFQTANGDLPPNEISTPQHLFVDTTAAATNIATINSFQTANGDLPPNEILTPHHLFVGTTTTTGVDSPATATSINSDVNENKPALWDFLVKDRRWKVMMSAGLGFMFVFSVLTLWATKSLYSFMSSCIECRVHEIKTCDSRMFESETYHSSGTEHADKYSDSRMLMSMTKIEQGLLFLIDKWLEKDAPQVQPTAEVHSITVLTQSSFVIIVIIICFILSARYITEQNKKMLTSFNESTGALGATLCAASRDAVKEEFTQVLKEQSILQVPLGRA